MLDHTLLQWKNLWQCRNDTVHSNEMNKSASEKRLRVQAELTHIYSRRDQYLARDKDILFDTLEDHKGLPTTSIQNWLLLYKDHLRESAKQSKRMALKNVKTIKEYFSKN